MNPLYALPEFSNLLLQASSSLREVGAENLADLFANALYDRSQVDQAIAKLRIRVAQGESPADPDGDAPWSGAGKAAQEYTLRLIQRLDRCISLNRVSL
ncbi:hypothetical protein DK254_00715 [Pseudomonas sp. RW407]|uniref:hypothetical protein n=1 Tax=Pseudomonas sp. RW407 TaxID=2202894 RepID=UPI000D6FF5F4|nr:hypothetical protein [Pseudomonas sp. RW407]PWU32075.1 hypothetical protein DK254_00715 [Pseudomonas sp. RW407]